MSRGFHAFFRQYYNLRSLIRRVDPALDCLTAVPDYPMAMAGGSTDSFGKIPRTPPLNLAAFVLRSPNFRVRDLITADIGAALELLDTEFPATYRPMTGRARNNSWIACGSRRTSGIWPWKCSPAASSPTRASSPPPNWSRCSTCISWVRRRDCCSMSPLTTTTPSVVAPAAIPGAARRRGADRQQRRVDRPGRSGRCPGPPGGAVGCLRGCAGAGDRSGDHPAIGGRRAGARCWSGSRRATAWSDTDGTRGDHRMAGGEPTAGGRASNRR